MDTNIVEMKSITKSFFGVHALKKVDYRIRKSKVNILIGENGAGKSTLMKILAGAIDKDEGSIYIDGKEVTYNTPIQAIENGIAMIYQELNLVQDLTVAENIFLGREFTNNSKIFQILNFSKQVEEARELLKSLGIELDPKAKLSNLSVAKQQMVEIAKAISLNAKVLIMDEPTSSLTETEVQQLFTIIKKLKNEGVSIVYISHRLNEIYEIGDNITVMRDGEFIGDWDICDLCTDDLIRHMVGREISQIYPKQIIELGDTILEVKNLTKQGKFKDISFSLRRGEILGLAGLVGAGRTEIANAIFGSDPAESGEITINGQLQDIKNPIKAIQCKIGFVPEDRKKEGVNLIDSVGRNICITCMKDISTLGFINKKSKLALSKKMIEKLNIKTPSVQQLVGNLSGGNQQKVVLAKWIAKDIDIIILDEPTRGVDVGAKSEIHALMTELAKTGVGIILISSELPEVIGMSDRVAVLHEGKLQKILEGDEINQETIMSFATNNLERAVC